MTNIQNMNTPNADKNIYGNSRLNSPVEMASLLNTGGVGGVNSARNSTRGPQQRVPHYSLRDVRFVEELGEGAFGKVRSLCKSPSYKSYKSCQSQSEATVYILG